MSLPWGEAGRPGDSGWRIFSCRLSVVLLPDMATKMTSRHSNTVLQLLSLETESDFTFFCPHVSSDYFWMDNGEKEWMNHHTVTTTAAKVISFFRWEGVM